MDPSIWSRIPDDLLYRILSLIPLPSLLSLRPTCKRFNSLLSSPSFLSLLHSSPSLSSPFLLLSHPQFSPYSLPLYSCSTDTWRSLPLLYPSLLSSSHGLLLFSLSSSSFLISNPLTNCSTKVRSPIPTIPAAITLISLPSSSPHGFSILLSSPNSNSLFLYRSSIQSWSRSPNLPSLKNPTFFNQNLYFTTPEPFSVIGFNLNWEQITTSTILDELAFVRLVSGGIEGNERLFLVGGIGRDGISRHIAVWEMVDEKWEEIGRLPELMCRKFVAVCYHNYAHVYCIWQEGMVCLCCTTWPEVLFLKVGRGTWHWLPRCPLLQEKWSCGFRWFAFTPDLYALV